MIKNSERITVVVPCYNVENYLARCLDSLRNQTHKNIEVIMVEDCSTDGTKKVVQKYEKKYPNFRAIYNEQNGGLGHARNVGIEAAKSKYIAFLDSDDWYPDNFLSEMYETLITNDADVVACDTYLRFDDPKLDYRVPAYSGKPDKFGLINTGISASSSSKLYKTELFKNLKYPEDIVNEDIPVTLTILSNYKTAYTDRTHFNYYQRTGSIQNGTVTKRRLEVFKAMRLLKENMGGKVEKKTWEVIVWHQIFAVLMFVIPRVKGVIARRQMIKDFYEVAKESHIKISSNNVGFRDFAKDGRGYRVYGEKLADAFNKKRFLKASLLMGLFSFGQKHKKPIKFLMRLLRVGKFAVRHPLQFLVRIKSKIFRKYVINNKVTLAHVVSAARKQSRLPAANPVSVIIPNYNYERYLIQRIYSILAQTAKIGEIIILDDNSTDGSVRLAKQIKARIDEYVPVRLINNKVNQGTFRQWELGFSEAKHEYIWIAEADDYSDARFLSYATAPLNDNPNVVISYVNTGYVDEKGLLLGDVKNDIDYQKSGHWNKNYVNDGRKEATTYSYINNTIANVSSVVFRKKAKINYAKLFADAREYRQAGDWVFYVNYMIQGDIAYTDLVLNYYRIHGENVSSTMKARDHINEILKIHKYFTKKLKLNNTQQNKMTRRVNLLRKHWGVQ